VADTPLAEVGRATALAAAIVSKVKVVVMARSSNSSNPRARGGSDVAPAEGEAVVVISHPSRIRDNNRVANNSNRISSNSRTIRAVAISLNRRSQSHSRVPTSRSRDVLRRRGKSASRIRATRPPPLSQRVTALPLQPIKAIRRRNLSVLLLAKRVVVSRSQRQRRLHSQHQSQNRPQPLQKRSRLRL